MENKHSVSICSVKLSIFFTVEFFNKTRAATWRLYFGFLGTLGLELATHYLRKY